MFFKTVVLGYSPQHTMVHMVSSSFHLTAHCHHINTVMLKKSLSDEIHFSHMAEASITNILKSDLIKVIGKIIPASPFEGN